MSVVVKPHRYSDNTTKILADWYHDELNNDPDVRDFSPVIEFPNRYKIQRFPYESPIHNRITLHPDRHDFLHNIFKHDLEKSTNRNFYTIKRVLLYKILSHLRGPSDYRVRSTQPNLEMDPKIGKIVTDVNRKSGGYGWHSVLVSPYSFPNNIESREQYEEENAHKPWRDLIIHHGEDVEDRVKLLDGLREYIGTTDLRQNRKRRLAYSYGRTF
jgi:hypothetical protein